MSTHRLGASPFRLMAASAAILLVAGAGCTIFLNTEELVTPCASAADCDDAFFCSGGACLPSGGDGGVDNEPEPAEDAGEPEASPEDAGANEPDASPEDAGANEPDPTPEDAGAPVDAGADDAGAQVDAGNADAGASTDAGATTDAGTATDAGTSTGDAGTADAG